MTHVQGATALTLSDINTTVNHEPRILDLRLAEALGFDRPRNIRKSIERHKNALERLGAICSTVEQNHPLHRGAGQTVATVATVKRGRPATEYYLTKKQAAYIAAKSETPNAIEITIHVIEVFDAATSGKALIHDAETHEQLLARAEQLRQAEVKELIATMKAASSRLLALGEVYAFADRRPMPDRSQLACHGVIDPSRPPILSASGHLMMPVQGGKWEDVYPSQKLMIVRGSA